MPSRLRRKNLARCNTLRGSNSHPRNEWVDTLSARTYSCSRLACSIQLLGNTPRGRTLPLHNSLVAPTLTSTRSQARNHLLCICRGDRSTQAQHKPRFRNGSRGFAFATSLPPLLIRRYHHNLSDDICLVGCSIPRKCKAQNNLPVVPTSGQDLCYNRRQSNTNTALHHSIRIESRTWRCMGLEEGLST